MVELIEKSDAAFAAYLSAKSGLAGAEVSPLNLDSEELAEATELIAEIAKSVFEDIELQLAPLREAA